MRYLSPALGSSVLLIAGAVDAQAGKHSTSAPFNHLFHDTQAVVAAATGSTAFNGMLGVTKSTTTGHYYVSSRRDTASTANPHMLWEFDQTGAFVQGIPQPAATSTSAWGFRDGAAVPGGGTGGRDLIYHGLEGNVLHAFDEGTGMFDATKDITVNGAPTTLLRALTFRPQSPTNGGRDSFASVNFGSVSFEIDRATGNVVGTTPSLTAGAYGYACFRIPFTRIRVYVCWSQSGATAGGSKPGSGLVGIAVDENGNRVGYEIYGDTIFPAGVAGGFDAYETTPLDGNPPRIIGVGMSQGGSPTGGDGFYEMELNFNYDVGCGPRIGSGGGGAWAGNAGFAIHGNGLTGAQAFLMISLTQSSVPLPGILACPTSVGLPLVTAIPAPVAAGAATWPIPIPAGTGGAELTMQLLDFTALPFPLSGGGRLFVHP
jgi:hypothetical protein